MRVKKYMEQIIEEVKEAEVASDEEVIEDEEKVTPAEPSTEEKPEEEIKPEPEPEIVLKPVEGETLKERAMRLEITKLRGKIRQERAEQLLSEPKKEEVKNPEADPLLEGYDPDELIKFETLFEAIAKKKGFARKEEIEKEHFTTSSNEVLDAFITNHPEYEGTNDPEGVLWIQFCEEFKLYKEPKSPKELKNLLDKVHNSFNPKLDSSALAAKQSKIKAASHGGVTQPAKVAQPADPALKAVLKGYNAEELKEMGL